MYHALLRLKHVIYDVEVCGMTFLTNQGEADVMGGYSLSVSSGNFTLDRTSLFFSPTDNKQEIYDTFVKRDVEQSPPTPPQYLEIGTNLVFSIAQSTRAL